MQEFDSAVAELFKTGIAFLMVSFLAYMFDKKIAHMLRMVAYLSLLSFVLTFILAGYTMMNDLIVALNKLSEWSLFGGFGK